MSIAERTNGLLLPLKKNEQPMILNMHNNKSKLIKTSPKVLINPEKKIALLWSAKAGSAFITKWFFYQMGVLTKAEEHSDWIHNYRKEIYKTPTYKQALENLIDKPNEYYTIKLVRNPYTRAVSSYVQSLLMLKINHPAAQELMTREGKLPLKEKYSFAEFLDALTFADIENDNMHWRCQTHPTERKGIITINTLIKLEASAGILNHLEQQLNLKPTEPSEFAASSHHNKKVESNEQSFIGNAPFSVAVRRNTPPYDCFYNAELKKKVQEIYKEDFERYQYAAE